LLFSPGEASDHLIGIDIFSSFLKIQKPGLEKIFPTLILLAGLFALRIPKVKRLLGEL